LTEKKPADSNEKPRLLLKEDWDVPISPPGQDLAGHFNGRRTDVNRLENELKRRSQGSVLICGHRGVGKTSTIYKAIRDAESSCKKNNITILSVLINAPQAIDEEKINTRRLLNLLITRLYTAANEEKVPEELSQKIHTLYFKAVASLYKTELKSNRQQQNQITLDGTSTTGLKWNWPLSSGLNNPTLAASFAAFGALQFGRFFENDFTSRILATIAIFVPNVISYAVEETRKTSFTRTQNSSSEDLYNLDNSIANLEFDLEQLHRELSKKKIKIVYVLDEMDKLANDQIKQILRYSKNLFTLASATFLFVASEEHYEWLVKNDQDRTKIYRNEMGTLFGSIFFLTRPGIEDIRDYLKAIVDQCPLGSNHLFDSLIFDAASDYFELIHKIRDRISGFIGANPYIEFSKDDPEDLIKARLQRSLSLIFDQKYSVRLPSRQKENEALLRTLYSKAGSLVVGNTISAPPNSDTTLGAAATRDFCKLLARIQIIQSMGTPPNGNAEHIYKRTGTTGFEVPEKMLFKTEYESAFIKKFEDCFQLSLSLINLSRSLSRQNLLSFNDVSISDGQFKSALNAISPPLVNNWANTINVYASLVKSEIPSEITRENIEVADKQLLLAEGILQQQIQVIIGGIMGMAVAGNQFLVQKIDTQGLVSHLPKQYEELRKSVSQVQHSVVTNRDYSKKVLVLGDTADETLMSLGSLLEQENSSLKVVVVPFTTSKSKYPKSAVVLNPFDIENAKEELLKLRRWLSGEQTSA
jgi:Cdc6-like AAA superfamily ATPase